jgi:hypothetical protein
LARGEPGIHNHETCRVAVTVPIEGTVVMDSGPRFARSE